ncbi:MAG: hypothetical protein LKE51_07505 [Selenomonas sp.]|jgi:hypothetical protein|nr:hypothetical protein [Selenomonas sp.]
MKRVSVELVPREEESLRNELTLLQQYQEQVDVINIPDLLRFDLRSWQGQSSHRIISECRCPISGRWISTSIKSCP